MKTHVIRRAIAATALALSLGAAALPVAAQPAATTAAPTFPMPRAESGAPRNVTATPGNERVRVRWTPPSNTGGNPVTGYRVQRRTVSGDWTTIATKSAGARSHRDRNRTNGMTYRYRVAAITSAGVGAFSSPVIVVLPKVKELGLGLAHTCAVLVKDGSVKCWGSNTAGQLGDGTQDNSPAPVKVVGLTGVRSLATGEKHNCVVVAGKRLKCWGGNDFGGIGDGTQDERLTPYLLSLTGVVQVGAGQFHTCARKDDGTVWCWGNNNSGQVGVDPNVTNPALTPVQVTGITDAVSIAVGYFHTCAILESGAAKCWGQNGSGELGDGNAPNDSFTPVTVAGLIGATRLSGGHAFTCARTSDALVHCWGANASGQVGDGTTDQRDAPTRVILLNKASSLATGESHACVRRANDGIRCWGLNDVGQVGNGSGVNEPTRVVVPGTVGATQVRTGKFHTCAIMATAAVQCWGENSDSQLGDRSTTDRTTPALAVRGL